MAKSKYDVFIVGIDIGYGRAKRVERFRNKQRAVDYAIKLLGKKPVHSITVFITRKTEYV